MKDFNDQLGKNKLNVADEKIRYLEENNEKLKIQNINMKNRGGLKEALRQQLKNCQ